MLEFLFKFGIAAICGILRAFVFTRLWSWFIIPTFHLAPLTIPFAFGLITVLRLLIHEEISEKDESYAEQIVSNISKTLIFWLFGWITTFFI